MSRIKAAICHTFGEQIIIKDIEISIPIDGEVEVTLATCAICRSIITYAKGH
ncbi:MAG: hypothetical protein OSA51_09920 [Octadecabacter sp.]|nr:hypothetical protein [Octadecabacter sp.]